MQTNTRTVSGQGFLVENVPFYTDETCKAHPLAVFRTKAAAEKRADYEALLATAKEYDGVEGIVAAQVEGFEGLWFVIFIYTDQVAFNTALAYGYKHLSPSDAKIARLIGNIANEYRTAAAVAAEEGDAEQAAYFTALAEKNQRAAGMTSAERAAEWKVAL